MAQRFDSPIREKIVSLIGGNDSKYNHYPQLLISALWLHPFRVLISDYHYFIESWKSGLIHSPAKGASSEMGTIGSNPILSAIFFCKENTMEIIIASSIVYVGLIALFVFIINIKGNCQHC